MEGKLISFQKLFMKQGNIFRQICCWQHVFCFVLLQLYTEYSVGRRMITSETGHVTFQYYHRAVWKGTQRNLQKAIAIDKTKIRSSSVNWKNQNQQKQIGCWTLGEKILKLSHKRSTHTQMAPEGIFFIKICFIKDHESFILNPWRVSMETQKAQHGNFYRFLTHTMAKRV